MFGWYPYFFNGIFQIYVQYLKHIGKCFSCTTGWIQDTVAYDDNNKKDVYYWNKLLKNHPTDMVSRSIMCLPRSISTGRFRSENTGIPWNMEAVFKPEIFSDFFQWFVAGSCRNAQEVDRNPPEKIRTISGRNTASSSREFRCFPAGSGDRNLRLGKWN